MPVSSSSNSGEFVEGLPGAGEERGFFEQIGGRVSADSEFGEDNQVGGLLCGAGGEVEYEASVSRKVADGWIDLG